MTEVSSPCTGVCALDAGTGVCRGCKRTIEEIVAWPTLDKAQKQAVWARLSGLTPRNLLPGHPETDS